MNVDSKMQESKTDDRDLLATSQDIELVRAMGMQFRKQSRLFANEMHQAKVIAREQRQQLAQVTSDRDRLLKLIDENSSIQTHGLQELCNNLQKQEHVITKQRQDIEIITKEFCQINNKATNMWLINERKNKVSFTSINNVKALLYRRKQNAAKMNVSLTWKDAETLMYDWHDDWAKQWWPLDDALKKAAKEN